MNPFVILQDLPCSTCKSECCGIVPILPSEFPAIQKYVRTMPKEERQRLEKQKREPLTCVFVDTEHWKCSIYPVRPLLCKLYGRTPGMQCPHAPDRSKEISEEDAHGQIACNIHIQPQDFEPIMLDHFKEAYE